MRPLSILLPALLLAMLLASCKRADRHGAAGAGGFNPMDRTQTVEVTPVATRDLEEKIELVGSLQANESAALRAELAGVVRAIHFEEGRSVRHGDPLIELDTRELSAQIAEASARAELADKNLTRAQQLIAANATSRLEFENAQAQAAQARAALKLLEVRLEKSTLRAPFDGVVGARTIAVGDYLTPEAVVTQLSDLSRLKVTLAVPERFLESLRPGSTFTLTAAGAGAPVTGEIYFIDPQINAQTRAAEVKGFIKEPPATLRPGMFANISLTLRKIPGAMVVPETAILNTPQGAVVIAARGEPGQLTAQFVPVRLGLRVPGSVQVTPAGPPLAVGEPVVSSGVGGLILMPGMKLNPVDPLRPPGPPAQTDRVLTPRGDAPGNANQPR